MTLKRATVLLLGAMWVLSAAAGQAEFAVRWDPSRSGPASAAEVLSALNLKAPKSKKFEVQYFSISKGEMLPAGYVATGRERASSGETEATYKVRGPYPPPQELAGWKCPFKGNFASKAEVDVTRTGEVAAKRSYSVSCSVDKSTIPSALPPGYSATPYGCQSKMERHKAGGLKIERWTLPQGGVLFEVSMEGDDSVAALNKFDADVVKPLLKRNATPLNESKTELGSRC